MRRLLVTPLLLSLPLTASLVRPAAAGPAPAVTREHRVTLTLEQVPLRDALQSAAAGSLSYVLGPGVGEVPVTLRLEDVTPQAALRLLVGAAARSAPEITHRRVEEVYVVYRREAAPGAAPRAAPPPLDGPAADWKVTGSLLDLPLGLVLSQLFAGSGIQHLLEPAVPAARVSVRLAHTPLTSVLRALAHAVPGMTAARRGEVYLLRVPGPELRPEEAMVPADVTRAEIDRRIALTARNAPLRDVVEQVFAGSGLPYLVAPDVPDVPLTLEVRDMELQSLLRVVVRLAAERVPDLTLSRRDGVYVIRRRGTESR
jgi:hypothetical protein